jgi:glycosyltransferase involved in cell wall biosynthesis
MNLSPTIFVAMPLYMGWEHVGQALRSLQTQTYANYRVLISVDGGDERSYDACTPFLSDSRFDIVLHSNRLGWAGNLNFLASHLREDFFCYWQHDDHCDPEYLEKLAIYAVANPGASAIYCDMEVYGEENRIIRQPSVTGFALERVLSQVKNPNVAAIRCLIRADALKASMPIKPGSIWVISLARSGELHRLPEILYHRRIRPDSLSFTMLGEPPTVLWRASLDWGLAVLENVGALTEEGDRTKLFVMVVDYLATGKVRLKQWYNLASASYALKVKFVRQLLDEASVKHALRPYLRPANEEVWLCGRRCMEGLSDAEGLLIDALIARELLPDDAIESGYVPVGIKTGSVKNRNTDFEGVIRRMMSKCFDVRFRR